MPHERWITLTHGNGGRFMRELISDLFARHLANPALDVYADAATWHLSGDLLFTTDGFTVQPLEFPGGDIGTLAVHGTVNDLAVTGALPRYLGLSAIIEEGPLPLFLLFPKLGDPQHLGPAHMPHLQLHQCLIGLLQWIFLHFRLNAHLRRQRQEFADIAPTDIGYALDLLFHP